jgi:hypothetical protein
MPLRILISAVSKRKANAIVGDCQCGGFVSSWAFSLIEFLVVTPFIPILASLLLRVLASAKQNGYRICCLNWLCQLRLFMQLYTDSNNDTFAGTRAYTWFTPQNGINPSIDPLDFTTAKALINSHFWERSNPACG